MSRLDEALRPFGMEPDALKEIEITALGLKFNKTAYFPPNSVVIGDGKISSSGRMLAAISLVTGNRAAISSQLFDSTKFYRGTLFDDEQVVQHVGINLQQDATSGDSETNCGLNIQDGGVLFTKLRFKPEGGDITEPFTFTNRINSAANLPTYAKTFHPGDSDLTNLGSGIWEIRLTNPTQANQGWNMLFTVDGISLLGSEGNTLYPTYGDPTKNHFFPWLQISVIPVIRNEIITEKEYNNRQKPKMKTSDFIAENYGIYKVDTTSNSVVVAITSDVDIFRIGDFEETFTNTNLVDVVLGTDTLQLKEQNKGKVYTFIRVDSTFRVYDAEGEYKGEGNV